MRKKSDYILDKCITKYKHYTKDTLAKTRTTDLSTYHMKSSTSLQITLAMPEREKEQKNDLLCRTYRSNSAQNHKINTYSLQHQIRKCKSKYKQEKENTH